MTITRSLFALLLALAQPCVACNEYGFDGDVLTLKCSLEGFQTCRTSQEQIDLLWSSLTDKTLFESGPSKITTPGSPPEDEQEPLFFRKSGGIRKESRDTDISLESSGDDVLTSLLDLTYSSQLRRGDHADSYLNALGFDLTAVITENEIRDFFFFVRELRKKNKMIPSVDLLKHPNFLCWRMQPVGEVELPVTYVGVLLKASDVKFADLKVYTLTETLSPEYLRRVKAALGAVMMGLTRESRSQDHKLGGYQFVFSDKDNLMKLVTADMGLSRSNNDLGTAPWPTIPRKRSYEDLYEAMGDVHYRDIKSEADRKEFVAWTGLGRED